MKCHEVHYEILGDDMQMVEVELDPGETVIAEAGAMNYMDDGIDFEARMGDGSAPDKLLFDKLLDAGRRNAQAHWRAHLHDPLHKSWLWKEASGLRRALSGTDRPGGHDHGWRRETLSEGCVPLCRARHERRHRVQQTPGGWVLRWRGVHSPAGCAATGWCSCTRGGRSSNAN